MTRITQIQKNQRIVKLATIALRWKKEGHNAPDIKEALTQYMMEKTTLTRTAIADYVKIAMTKARVR